MRSEQEIREMLQTFQQFARADRYMAEKDTLQWVLGEFSEKPTEIIHGVNCQKVVHDRRGMLHSADDDGPFEFNGAKYCGRCHAAL